MRYGQEIYLAIRLNEKQKICLTTKSLGLLVSSVLRVHLIGNSHAEKNEAVACDVAVVSQYEWAPTPMTEDAERHLLVAKFEIDGAN